MDVDNRSIRVLILPFEALPLFYLMSVSQMKDVCVGQTLSPKTKHSSKNTGSVPLIAL